MRSAIHIVRFSRFPGTWVRANIVGNHTRKFAGLSAPPGRLSTGLTNRAGTGGTGMGFIWPAAIAGATRPAGTGPRNCVLYAPPILMLSVMSIVANKSMRLIRRPLTVLLSLWGG